MNKSPFLFKTLRLGLTLHSGCRLPSLPSIYHQPRYIQHTVAVCYDHRRFYSSRYVSKLEKIYEGPASKNIFMLKLLSLTTSLTAVILELALFTSSASVAMKVGWSFAGCFTFCTPFIAHIVLRKYVSRIYYDASNDSYTAVLYTIFATKKYITFTVNDVKPLNVEILSTVRVKGRPMFFDPDFFTDVYHYKRLLGYDKPINADFDASALKEDLEKLRKSKAESKESS